MGQFLTILLIISSLYTGEIKSNMYSLLEELPNPAKNSLCVDIQSSYAGAMIGGAIGDGMGRPTERIKSLSALWKRYPKGIRTMKDFKKTDWPKRHGFTNKQYKRMISYTDDTAMSKTNLEVLIKMCQKKIVDAEKIMSNLAVAYCKELGPELHKQKSIRGWGKQTRKAIFELESRIAKGENNTPNWWDIQEITNGGGNGSVMRAHPFGLIYWDNPEIAASLAAQHSKITHGHPMALAACAAMATGIAYAVQKKSPEYIVQEMIRAATKYDPKTADRIKAATIAGKNALDLLKSKDEKQFNQYNNTILETYLGWNAQDAIAATVYVFTVFPNDPLRALALAIHTAGDSDSLGSMSLALIGALLGEDSLPSNTYLKGIVEGRQTLRNLAYTAATCVESKSRCPQ